MKDEINYKLDIINFCYNNADDIDGYGLNLQHLQDMYINTKKRLHTEYDISETISTFSWMEDNDFITVDDEIFRYCKINIYKITNYLRVYKIKNLLDDDRL